MERIKIDNTRKQITLKDRVSFGKQKVVKGKYLSEISENFDKDLSSFYNKGGFTYVFENPKSEQEEEIDVDLKSKVEVEDKLKKAYFAGLSEEDKIRIQEIKDEYDI